MRNSIIQTGIYVSMLALLSSCEPLDTQDFHVDKPESVIAQEELDSYGDLKTYLNKGNHPSFHLGASVTLEDYTSKGLMFRLLNRNFDEVSMSNFNHGAIVQANGSLSLDKILILSETTKEAGVSVFGNALVSSSDQNATYLNSAIAPLIITGDAAKVVVANFDNDNLGTSYPMSNGGSGTVVLNNVSNSGRVLRVQGAQSFPRFTVTLPQGRTLGDYVSVILDMYATGSTGLYGQGMRMSVNGGTVGNYGSPSSFGVADGVWSTGKIKLPLANLNLTAQQKALTTFTLQLGSATGAANYYIDNIVLQDINVPKTQQQKVQIIEDELEKWITSVVDTAKHFTKAWDVVKDPMDDAQPTEIRTGVGKTLAAGEFFWQDYLGKDYAVKAFQLARQSANPDDQLFIAENNLLANPAKLNGLVSYISYIEGKGAVIDGISADLALTVNTDKTKIDELFSALAATGKLIRVVSGFKIEPAITKANVNSEYYLQQADMHRYVVDKYFELVPKEQRYGITFKSLLNEIQVVNGINTVYPNGIWTEGYVRKPAYMGVAEGLNGK